MVIKEIVEPKLLDVVVNVVEIYIVNEVDHVLYEMEGVIEDNI